MGSFETTTLPEWKATTKAMRNRCSREWRWK